MHPSHHTIPCCASFSFFSDFTPSSLTQSLMTEVVQNSNVVEVTNQPGFLENLETLQQRLSVCEKALAEYLETKRLTFPRFYFVSASDLLEIVSKGTQPKQVTDYNLIMFSKRKHTQKQSAHCSYQYNMFFKPCLSFVQQGMLIKIRVKDSGNLTLILVVFFFHFLTFRSRDYGL